MGIAREKIALLVFALAMVGAAFGVVLYLVVGHSWNVAAAHVDATIEEYERFNVVVYEGVTGQALDALEDGKLGPEVAQVAADVDELSARYTQVQAEALADRYRKQDASVLLLDLMQPARYEEGCILKFDNARFGVVSVTAADTQEDIQEKVDYLNSHQVDMTVVLAPYRSIMQGIKGADVAVILASTVGHAENGKVQDGICYAYPPGYGYTGAALMSENGVVLVKQFPYGDYSKRAYELGI